METGTEVDGAATVAYVAGRGGKPGGGLEEGGGVGEVAE